MMMMMMLMMMQHRSISEREQGKENKRDIAHRILNIEGKKGTQEKKNIGESERVMQFPGFASGERERERKRGKAGENKVIIFFFTFLFLYFHYCNKTWSISPSPRHKKMRQKKGLWKQQRKESPPPPPFLLPPPPPFPGPSLSLSPFIRGVICSLSACYCFLLFWGRRGKEGKGKKNDWPRNSRFPSPPSSSSPPPKKKTFFVVKKIFSQSRAHSLMCSTVLWPIRWRRSTSSYLQTKKEKKNFIYSSIYTIL